MYIYLFISNPVAKNVKLTLELMELNTSRKTSLCIKKVLMLGYLFLFSNCVRLKFKLHMYLNIALDLLFLNAYE